MRSSSALFRNTARDASSPNRALVAQTAFPRHMARACDQMLTWHLPSGEFGDVWFCGEIIELDCRGYRCGRQDKSRRPFYPQRQERALRLVKVFQTMNSQSGIPGILPRRHVTQSSSDTAAYVPKYLELL